MNNFLIFKILRILKTYVLQIFINIDHEKLELSKIKKIIKSKTYSTVTIVYDLKVSPPTIGDFLSVVMLCRYFSCYSFKVNFLILNDTLRDDWQILNNEQASKFILQLESIYYDIQNNNKSTLCICTSETDMKQYVEIENVYVPYKNFCVNRIPIYTKSFNLLNLLLASESTIFLNNFLLSKETFQLKCIFNVPKIPYITWHLRYNEKWGVDRNINKSTFYKIYNSLKNLYYGYKIIIISDKVGCLHVKNFLSDDIHDISFSIDFSEGFIQSAHLILNSSFYFQYRGGGIGMIPVYSNIPYIIIETMAYEKMWSLLRFTSWANPKQTRFLSIDYNNYIFKPFYPTIRNISNLN
jgi:hypothetical protein